MISFLSLALLLDYSGSMHQQVDAKPKVDILKQQTSGLIEALPPGSQVGVILFGSNPVRGCADLAQHQGGSEEILDWINSRKVGTFGKTPLSRGIRDLGDTIQKKNVSNAVILTDGGDSCGEDPCKALRVLDKNLGIAGKTLNLVLISFDFKRANSGLRCLDTLSLNSIQLIKADAKNGNEVNAALKQMQERSLYKDQNKLDLKNGNQQNNRTQSGRSGEDVAGGRKSEKSPNNDNLSLVEIMGAPIEAQFESQGKKGKRTWRGNFVMQTEPGSYQIRFIDKNGLTKMISLSAGEHIQIPWAELMTNSVGQIELSDRLLALKFEPDENTKEIHGKLSVIEIQVDLESDAVIKKLIPFGSYLIKVDSPPWLKDRFDPVRYTIDRGQLLSFSLKEIFQDKVQLVDNPHSEGFSVLELKSSNGSLSSYLLSPGHRRVPIPTESQFKFLLK